MAGIFTNRPLVAIIAWLIFIGAAPAANPELSRLPGVLLNGVWFGMEKADFLKVLPDAEPYSIFESASKDGPSIYTIKSGDGRIHRLNFKGSRLAGCKVTWTGLTPETQEGSTHNLVGQLTNTFGAPDAVDGGKLTPQGIAEFTILLFEADGYLDGAKAVLQSSQVEMSVHYVFEPLMPAAEVLAPSLKARSLVGQPSRQGTFGAVPNAFDYLQGYRSDPGANHDPRADEPKVTNAIGAVDARSTSSPTASLDNQSDVNRSRVDKRGHVLRPVLALVIFGFLVTICGWYYYSRRR